MPTKAEALAAYATEQAAINDQQDAAVDGIVKDVDGLTADVKFITDKLNELQNTPDGWTTADQAILDAARQRSTTTADKLKALGERTKALDALTNPEPPAPTS